MILKLLKINATGLSPKGPASQFQDLSKPSLVENPAEAVAKANEVQVTLNGTQIASEKLTAPVKSYWQGRSQEWGRGNFKLVMIQSSQPVWSRRSVAKFV